MNDFSRKAIAVLQQIPRGKVSTYGTVAFLAGSPGGARQIVRILHTSSEKHGIPWHRVVNRFGQVPPRPSMSHLKQISMLKDEGIDVDESGIIDLETYLWQPTKLTLE